ncbi:unnamed protein product [Moneuplotes crassus]|uniref:Uncharacterized protein n=1 Tax=Euplotes crassus TaxID=5936 RepID=A0AAD1X976_EUPCR|nr:unnamed protein product [Moneuplotes crassus]
MKIAKGVDIQRKTLDERKENDTKRLMELLDDCDIFRGEETTNMFQRAGITYLSILQAIQLQDHMYLGSLQTMCQLSNEEMSILSYNVLRRLKDQEHNESMLGEYGPQFYSALRPPMNSMPGPGGFPMHQFYRDQNINQGMNPMIYDHLTRDQQYPAQFIGMPYQNMPYYIEQLNHNTTVYNNLSNEQMKMGKASSKSKKSGKKSTATDTSTKELDDSTIAGTKEKDSGNTRSYMKDDSVEMNNISSQLKDLVDISPYFYSNAMNLAYMPSDGKKAEKLKKRDQKDILKQAYGIMPPKDPRMLTKASTLHKGRPIRYGNYRSISLISYDERADPPKSGEDIFYPGRGFRSVNDLNDALERYKIFGFSLIKKKTEVKRGRYELRCQYHSERKKKSIFADEDDKIFQPCSVHVYIDKLKVKNIYLQHNHQPEFVANPTRRVKSQKKRVIQCRRNTNWI